MSLTNSWKAYMQQRKAEVRWKSQWPIWQIWMKLIFSTIWPRSMSYGWKRPNTHTSLYRIGKRKNGTTLKTLKNKKKVKRYIRQLLKGVGIRRVEDAHNSEKTAGERRHITMWKTRRPKTIHCIFSNRTLSKKTSIIWSRFKYQHYGFTDFSTNQRIGSETHYD